MSRLPNLTHEFECRFFRTNKELSYDDGVALKAHWVNKNSQVCVSITKLKKTGMYVLKIHSSNSTYFELTEKKYFDVIGSFQHFFTSSTLSFTELLELKCNIKLDQETQDQETQDQDQDQDQDHETQDQDQDLEIKSYECNFLRSKNGHKLIKYVTLGNDYEISVTRRNIKGDFDFLVTLHKSHAVVKQDVCKSRKEVTSLLDSYYRSSDLDSFMSESSFSHPSIVLPSESYNHRMNSLKKIKRIFVSYKGESFFLLSNEELKDFLDKIEGVFHFNYLTKSLEIIELNQNYPLEIKMKDDKILDILIHFHFFFELSSKSTKTYGILDHDVFVIKHKDSVKFYVHRTEFPRGYILYKEGGNMPSNRNLAQFLAFELGKYRMSSLAEYQYDSINDEYIYSSSEEETKHDSIEDLCDQIFTHIINDMDEERIRIERCLPSLLIVRDKNSRVTFEFLNKLSTDDFKALKGILKEGM